MRHNNVSKVHIQKFISEVKDGVYPAPDVFVLQWAQMIQNLMELQKHYQQERWTMLM